MSGRAVTKKVATGGATAGLGDGFLRFNVGDSAGLKV
jgi:hypothetical protein